MQLNVFGDFMACHLILSHVDHDLYRIDHKPTINPSTSRCNFLQIPKISLSLIQTNFAGLSDIQERVEKNRERKTNSENQQTLVSRETQLKLVRREFSSVKIEPRVGKKILQNRNLTYQSKDFSPPKSANFRVHDDARRSVAHNWVK